MFKPTIKYKDGRVKGNCDAELVLQTMIDYGNYAKAVIISGDGDFHCLIDYLSKKDKLEKVIVPDVKNYSALLKKFNSRLTFLNDLRKKLEYKKGPNRPKNKNHPVRTKP